MEEDKASEEAENWKIYEALCSKSPTEVSLLLFRGEFIRKLISIKLHLST